MFGKQIAAVAAVAASCAIGSMAEATTFCPPGANNVCFSWGVPDASASAGSGNIYFQLKAPTSYSWVGLGIGQQMRGADIFLMYADGKGNVTLSTRAGVGQIMPRSTPRSDVTLLAGSGVVNGQMIANVKCGQCTNLNLKGSNNWISAWKDGDAIGSTAVDSPIQYHDSHAQYQVDFSKATISSDANPFVNAQGGQASPTGTPNNNGGGGAVVETGNNNKNLILAHGIIMTVVFTAMYPMGAILMPIIGKWFIHAGWQTIAFLAMWAGLGIGYTVAKDLGIFFTQPHTQLGIIVCALMGIQPILGWVHHTMYTRSQRRTVVSHVHVWYGRAVMILGIVNGGLGLQLASSGNAFKYAYIIVAAVVGAMYIGVVLLKARSNKSGRGNKEGDISPQMSGAAGNNSRYN